MGTVAEHVGDPHGIRFHVVDPAGRALPEAGPLDHRQPPALSGQGALPCEGDRTAAQAALHAAVDDQHLGPAIAEALSVDRQLRGFRFG